jgi:hypothetical protein
MRILSSSQRTRIAAVALVGTLPLQGCLLAPAPEQVYVCYQTSNFRNKEFAYGCEQRDTARVAGAVCSVIGVSADSIIQANRRVGPTTPTRLFLEAGVDTLVTKTMFQEYLGDRAADAYLEYIVSMSSEIAQRNITDLITYPEQQFSECLKQFNYALRK